MPDGGLLGAAREAWRNVVERGPVHGIRNAQASVLAPTGTIGFMMDCDTTGVEPDIALVKYKKLVGGGVIKLVNNTVPRALRKLGYSDAEVDAIIQYVDEHETIEGAPGTARRAPVGVRLRVHPAQRHALDHRQRPHQDDGRGAAVHLGRDLQDGQHADRGDARGDRRRLPAGLEGGRQGPRDLPRRLQAHPAAVDRQGAARSRRRRARPVRRRMPDEREAITHHFSIADHDGYVTVGKYEDGSPGEVFMKMAKQGSTVSGLMDSLAICMSLALQHGVPLQVMVDKLSHMRFEPSGFTGNPEIPMAKSIVDYLVRWLAAQVPVRGRAAPGRHHHRPAALRGQGADRRRGGAGTIEVDGRPAPAAKVIELPTAQPSQGRATRRARRSCRSHPPKAARTRSACRPTARSAPAAAGR